MLCHAQTPRLSPPAGRLPWSPVLSVPVVSDYVGRNPRHFVKCRYSAKNVRENITAIDKAAIKVELRSLLAELSNKHGRVAALLPGLQEDKARIDELIRQLQRAYDHSAAAEAAARVITEEPVGNTSSSTGASIMQSIIQSKGINLDGRVPGEWELVYASNGTVVTRTPLVQALVAISNRSLRGFGISDIKQELRTDEHGVLVATNEAVLGLGPLGSWKLGIEGKWLNKGDGRTSRVVFDQVQIKPVGLLGLPLPSWLPQAVFGMGSSEDPRAGADWETPFVDEDMRIGVGRPSGNTFLFFRRSSDTGTP